jgi:hypothetical protein
MVRKLRASGSQAKTAQANSRSAISARPIGGRHKEIRCQKNLATVLARLREEKDK